jgi:arginase family enzyme
VKGNSMQVCLIQVPYMIGDEHHGASKGPRRYVRAAEKLLAAREVVVTVERTERGGPFRDSPSASLAVNKQLAPIVRQSVAAGQLPLVLSGS